MWNETTTYGDLCINHLSTKHCNGNTNYFSRNISVCVGTFHYFCGNISISLYCQLCAFPTHCVNLSTMHMPSPCLRTSQNLRVHIKAYCVGLCVHFAQLLSPCVSIVHTSSIYCVSCTWNVHILSPLCRIEQSLSPLRHNVPIPRPLHQNVPIPAIFVWMCPPMSFVS